MPATLGKKKKGRKKKRKVDDPITAAVKVRLPLHRQQQALRTRVDCTHDVDARLFDSITTFVRTNRLSSVVQFLDGDASLVHGTGHYTGFTLLHNAVAYNDDATMVATLLRYGSDVNARSARSTFEQTPLHVAASVNKWQLADMMLSTMADINAADSNGQTPLHIAASVGHDDFVMWLLDHSDCDAQRLDAHGHCAQYYALKGGHLALSARIPGRPFNMMKTLIQTDAFRLEYLPKLEKAKEAKKAKAAARKNKNQNKR